jgi:hypothetical protein
LAGLGHRADQDIDPLTNPTPHGASPMDAFPLVILSLLSHRARIGDLNATTRLQGIRGAGRRLGQRDLRAMALQQPPGLLGIHTNMVAMVPAEISRALASRCPCELK